MNPISLLSISTPSLAGNEMVYLAECIRSGWVSSKGPYVQRFEEAFAAWCERQHGIATSSGTNALHLALLACNIGLEDEVIVPALSYVASANAIAYTGATPVFVDVHPETWNMDIAHIENKITPRTKAIMAVHLYGHPMEMDSLCQIAEKYSLYLIEDACQAHGSEYQGKRVGGIGHIGCFSFYGNKLITTGEGGMIVTNSDALAETVRLLRNQGAENGSYWHPHLGFSYRMTNLQAAVGVAQLEQVEDFIAARERIACLYSSLLGDIPGLIIYRDPVWAKSVCWLYSCLVGPEFGMSRDDLVEFLRVNGIESKPFFQPIPNLPIYHKGSQYPIAEYIAGHGISLPTATNLLAEQIHMIVKIIQKAQHIHVSKHATKVGTHAYLSSQSGL